MRKKKIKQVKIGNCTLYCGDCLDVLKTISDVDHVITDPPYSGIMQCLHSKTSLKRKDKGAQRKKLNFDSMDNLMNPFLIWAKENVFNWMLAFSDIDSVKTWRDSSIDHGLKYKLACIWHKPDSAPKLNGQSPAICYECINVAWCGKGHSSWNGGGKRGMYTHMTNNKDRHGVHPTEKPVSLMKELINDFTDMGDLICDPFMGSGTTGVACQQMGRKFIGIEKDEKYFEIACKRILEASRQEDLFSLKSPGPIFVQTDIEEFCHAKVGSI